MNSLSGSAGRASARASAGSCSAVPRVPQLAPRRGLRRASARGCARPAGSRRPGTAPPVPRRRPGAAQSRGVHLVDEGLLRGQEHPLGQAAFVDHRDQVRAVAQLAAQGPGHGDDARRPGCAPAGRISPISCDGALDEGVEQRLAVADVPVDGGDGGAQLGGELAHGQGGRAVLLAPGARRRPGPLRGSAMSAPCRSPSVTSVLLRARVFTLHPARCNCVTASPRPTREGWYETWHAYGTAHGPRRRSPPRAPRAPKLPDIWSTGVVAVWESDPDAVAAVLPPPAQTHRAAPGAGQHQQGRPARLPAGRGLVRRRRRARRRRGLVPARHADDPRAGPDRRP